MNRLLLSSLFMGLLCYSTKAQSTIHLAEPDFTFPNSWQGDTAAWHLGQSRGTGNPLFVQGPIQLQDSVEVLFELNPAFATSSNNYVELQFYAEPCLRPDSFTGYLIRIGHTPDEVSFYAQEGLLSNKRIDGLDKRLASSSNNRVEIRLKKSQNLWTLETRLAGEQNWLNEGYWTDTSALHLTGLGLYFRYSASNAEKLNLYQLHVDYPYHDITPPQVLSIESWSKQACLVHLDEAPVFSQKPTLKLNNAVVAASLEKYESNSVLLYLDSGSWPEQNVHIELSGLSDEAGNQSIRWDSTMAFNQNSAAFIFSEIQYDPSPNSPWPDAEYLEVWNAGTETLRLDSFLFAEQDSFYFPAQSFIPPNTRLVLCRIDDSRFFDSIPHLAFPFRKGFLSNAGERLLLADRNHQILDSFTYNSTWHDQTPIISSSLEIKDKTATCFNLNERWGTCLAMEGGTPGKANSINQILVDSTSPTWLDFGFNDSLISLHFSEAIHSIGQLQLDQSSLPLLTKLPSAVLQFSLHPKLISNPNKFHQLRLSGFADCSSNTIGDTLTSFRYAVPKLPEEGEIHITEILFRPLNGQEAFLEVHNAGEEVIKLSSLELDYKGKRYTLPEILLFPSEVVVLSKSINWPGMPSLSTVSGNLALYRKDQSFPLDYVSYSLDLFTEAAKQAGGFSLEKRSDDGCYSAEIWNSSSNYGGNPGTFNPDLKQTETSFPELLQVYPLDSSLRFHFTTEIPPANFWNSTWLMEGQSISPVQLHSFTLDPFTVEIRFSSVLPEAGNIVLEDLKTCSGQNAEFSYSLPAVGKLTNLYFNEVYFHPNDAETDYIELYNASDSAIDLKNTLISSLNPDGSLKNQVRLFPEGFLLCAGQYLVLSEELPWITRRFSDVPLQNLMASPLPSMNSDEGILVLHDSLGGLLDSLSYSVNQHAAAIQNPKGVSLEKVRESEASSHSIWTSASASSQYGTPGKRNSQFRGITESEDLWTLDSRRMSPDQDGYEDLLLIRYKTAETGLRVVIHITDFSGNLIATLAEGEPLGSNGTYAWDGRNKEGKLAKPGAYCAFIQTYSGKGSEKQHLSFSVLSKN
ncbi:MAG: hypothetical protein EP332_05280 [Bacteroidetes bacterium]|nr:MAG: hypothetical protein EP332_05280 [Bacteroidota bacterium]